MKVTQMTIFIPAIIVFAFFGYLSTIMSLNTLGLIAGIVIILIIIFKRRLLKDY